MNLADLKLPADTAVFIVKVNDNNAGPSIESQLQDIIGPTADSGSYKRVSYTVEAKCQPQMLAHLARGMIQFLANGIPGEMLAFISVEIFKSLEIERGKNRDEDSHNTNN